MVKNVHTRDLGVPAGQFVERIQELWPPAWGRQEFDRPLGVGADGGHGPIRSSVRVAANPPHQPGGRSGSGWCGGRSD
jgi:hypothetical protein